jgi:DNA primase
MNTHGIFERVRDRVDPLEFYRKRCPSMREMRPGREGWVCGGLCPFHRDRHAGSFRVNVGTGGFKCFSCNARGADVIAFDALLEGVERLEAARAIEREWEQYQ